MGRCSEPRLFSGFGYWFPHLHTGDWVAGGSIWAPTLHVVLSVPSGRIPITALGPFFPITDQGKLHWHRKASSQKDTMSVPLLHTSIQEQLCRHEQCAKRLSPSQAWDSAEKHFCALPPGCHFSQSRHHRPGSFRLESWVLNLLLPDH